MMGKKWRVIFIFCVFTSHFLFAGGENTVQLSGQVLNEENVPVESATVGIPALNLSSVTDKYGQFFMIIPKSSEDYLVIFKYGYKTVSIELDTTKNKKKIRVKLEPISKELDEVVIQSNENQQLIQRLRNIEGTQIYASKKNDLIKLSKKVVNKATGNARQIYSEVSGLNIWESDVSGLRLDIGGRGLSPSRTANYNTRQNGYDISADALGYPESYYTPTSEAIERIEIIRGAASLQYGSQFGGLINFQLKEGNNKPFHLSSRVSTGSFGLLNMYQELGAKKGKNKLFGFLHYRKGDGFRPHSGFESYSAYIVFSHKFSEKSRLKAEYTQMNYLAQQPGGLTDKQFKNDPYQSTRSRNWFQVKWHLPAISWEYKLQPSTTINTKMFGLIASRSALGYLNAPIRKDPGEMNEAPAYLKQRDLLSDEFYNIGMESRILHRYDIGNGRPSALATGVRLYRGFSNKMQGNGTSGNDANFNYINPNFPGKIDYTFTNYNGAVFAENHFNFTEKFTVTPGFRAEFIETNANGKYREMFRAPNGDILRDTIHKEKRMLPRKLMLLGIGISYKLSDDHEVFTNFSQNYRSITFNNFRVDNPTYRVDQKLEDEKGFNADLGVRGSHNKWLSYDITAFYLRYANRIGTIPKINEETQSVDRFLTNVGVSNTIGIESLINISFSKLLNWENHHLQWFVNFSWLSGRYADSEKTNISGNKVELVPDFICKTGITYTHKWFAASALYTYVNDHYSDASNAVRSHSSIIGLIPSYRVVDLSVMAKKGKFAIETGVNNLLNTVYFTQRATGYPGPGILTAAPRNLYFTLSYQL